MAMLEMGVGEGQDLTRIPDSFATGSSNLASQVAEWESVKSLVARYAKPDLILEELVSRIESQVRESEETVLSTISISLVYLVIFASGALWLASLVLGFEAPVPGDNVATVEWLLHRVGQFLSPFGVSETITGNKYLLSLLASLLVAFLSETGVTREIRRKTRQYLEVVEKTQSRVHGARQIFLSAGQIRFSYGTLGVWVRGGNLNLNILWAAIERGAFYSKSMGDWLEVDDPNKASHFFVFLKPRSERDESGTEVLVVPKRFLRKSLDANSWEEFVTGFDSFLARAQSR